MDSVWSVEKLSTTTISSATSHRESKHFFICVSSLKVMTVALIFIINNWGEAFFGWDFCSGCRLASRPRCSTHGRAVRSSRLKCSPCQSMLVGFIFVGHPFFNFGIECKRAVATRPADKTPECPHLLGRFPLLDFGKCVGGRFLNV